ncbi:MAG: 3-keto-5-aminohexanoate cleavage protein [Deltaproteobacteria bacterium]|nr:3-keto-5-aminohexanoate cleavage protein [Deltaproteobacteria bacterium]
MHPLMITAALVGAELTRQQQAYLPLTPKEIAQSGIEAVEAGASVLHLHVRDSFGNPTCDEKIFQEVIDRIREKVNPILQVSTGGSVYDLYEDRLRPLKTTTDMASLTTGSINFGSEVFLNPIPFVDRLAQTMKEKEIKPEIEVFDLSMLEKGIDLIQNEIIKSPAHFQFVLGVPGALKASEENLRYLVSRLPKDSTWSLSAIGRFQFQMLPFAIQWGGHARVGFEDNLYLEKGMLAKTNADLVTKLVDLSVSLGRRVATLEEARNILFLAS